MVVGGRRALYLPDSDEDEDQEPEPKPDGSATNSLQSGYGVGPGSNIRPKSSDNGEAREADDDLGTSGGSSGRTRVFVQVLKLMNFASQLMDCVLKMDELCIKNDGLSRPVRSSATCQTQQ